MFGGSPFKITGNGRAMPTVLNISGKSSETFKVGGGPMEYSSVQVSRDPSLGVHWLNARVCAWEGDVCQHGVVSKWRMSPATGFKVTPDDGPEFNRWFSAEKRWPRWLWLSPLMQRTRRRRCHQARHPRGRWLNFESLAAGLVWLDTA